MSECQKISEYKYVRIFGKKGKMIEGWVVALEDDEKEHIIHIKSENGYFGIREREIDHWNIPAAFYGIR